MALSANVEHKQFTNRWIQTIQLIHKPINFSPLGKWVYSVYEMDLINGMCPLVRWQCVCVFVCAPLIKVNGKRKIKSSSESHLLCDRPHQKNLFFSSFIFNLLFCSVCVRVSTFTRWRWKSIEMISRLRSYTFHAAKEYAGCCCYFFLRIVVFSFF